MVYVVQNVYSNIQITIDQRKFISRHMCIVLSVIISTTSDASIIHKYECCVYK